MRYFEFLELNRKLTIHYCNNFQKEERHVLSYLCDKLTTFHMWPVYMFLAHIPAFVRID
jgi:hypothetical protein